MDAYTKASAAFRGLFNELTIMDNTIMTNELKKLKIQVLLVKEGINVDRAGELADKIVAMDDSIYYPYYPTPYYPTPYYPPCTDTPAPYYPDVFQAYRDTTAKMSQIKY